MYRYIRHIEKIEELDVLSYFTILSKASERCSYSVPGNTRPGGVREDLLGPGNTSPGVRVTQVREDTSPGNTSPGDS